MILRKVRSVTRPSIAQIRGRFHFSKLKHQLNTGDDFIKLILAKLRIGVAEIRPSVNIVEHQLEIVAVDVVVDPTGN